MIDDYTHSAFWIFGGIAIFIAAVRFSEAYLSRISLPKNLGSGAGVFLLVIILAATAVYVIANQAPTQESSNIAPIIRPIVQFSMEELATWNEEELRNMAYKRIEESPDSSDLMSILRELQSRSPTSTSTVIKLLEKNPNPVVIQSLSSSGAGAKDALTTLDTILDDFDNNCWDPSFVSSDEYIQKICSGGKSYRALVVDSYNSIAQAVSEQEIGNSSSGTDQLNLALIDAISSNDLESVKNALSKGASPNAIVVPLAEPGVTLPPTTPLRSAIQVNAPEVVALLVSVGADINKRPWPALCEAIRFNNEKIVQYLLEQGAKPDLYDGDGSQPLRLAVSKSNSDIVEMLLAYKADARRFDVSDKNAYMAARASNNPKIFAMIKAELPEDYQPPEPLRVIDKATPPAPQHVQESVSPAQSSAPVGQDAAEVVDSK